MNRFNTNGLVSNKIISSEIETPLIRIGGDLNVNDAGNLSFKVRFIYKIV